MHYTRSSKQENDGRVGMDLLSYMQNMAFGKWLKLIVEEIDKEEDEDVKSKLHCFDWEEHYGNITKFIESHSTAKEMNSRFKKYILENKLHPDKHSGSGKEKDKRVYSFVFARLQALLADAEEDAL